MAFNHEGQQSAGTRNGKNILTGVGGRTANYRNYLFYGKPASDLAQKHEDKIGRKLSREKRRRVRDAKATSHQGLQTEANAAYWAMVQKYLAKGLSLDEAKAKCKKRGIKR